jgi:hypothetical protein
MALHFYVDLQVANRQNVDKVNDNVDKITDNVAKQKTSTKLPTMTTPFDSSGHAPQGLDDRKYIRYMLCQEGNK